jgi:5-methylcytosine-specific restriction endonuclease McrA
MSSYVTEGKRKRVYERDKYCCRYCGEYLKGKKGRLSIDHVIPKSKGGDNSLENLVTACPQCQWKKGAKSLEEAGMSLISL